MNFHESSPDLKYFQLFPPHFHVFPPIITYFHLSWPILTSMKASQPIAWSCLLTQYFQLLRRLLLKKLRDVQQERKETISYRFPTSFILRLSYNKYLIYWGILDASKLAYLHTCIHVYLNYCIPDYMHACELAYLQTFIHSYVHTCIIA